MEKTNPALTLSCASQTLRENVMEPNVDIKRLPPAQEKIKEKPTQQTPRQRSERDFQTLNL
jgi:hypothetical protein